MLNELFSFLHTACLYSCILYVLHAHISQQVQDIEFMQIEMEVIEGLKVGNHCLKTMHEVDVFSLFSILSFECKNMLFKPT